MERFLKTSWEISTSFQNYIISAITTVCNNRYVQGYKWGDGWSNSTHEKEKNSWAKLVIEWVSCKRRAARFHPNSYQTKQSGILSIVPVALQCFIFGTTQNRFVRLEWWGIGCANSKRGDCRFKSWFCVRQCRYDKCNPLHLHNTANTFYLYITHTFIQLPLLGNGCGKFYQDLIHCMQAMQGKKNSTWTAR